MSKASSEARSACPTAESRRSITLHYIAMDVETNERIAILGAGQLGESMLRGFLSSGWREPGEVVVTSRRAERRDALAALCGVEATADNIAAIGGARLVILSVKPQD